VFGLYTAPSRYDLYCEPFAERITLPRRGREQALLDVVQRYADRLEEHARRAPDNWFNFYDFWGSARERLDKLPPGGSH
jgi:predicted LPLAT superfamily acyltransferase